MYHFNLPFSFSDVHNKWIHLPLESKNGKSLGEKLQQHMEEEGSTVWLDICASRGTPGTCEEERSCACKVPQLFSAQFVWHHLSEQGCVRVTGSVVLYMVKAARGLYFALCVGVN